MGRAPLEPVLLETLDAWLSCEGSAGRAAGRLCFHRNTSSTACGASNS
ncbi:helix-turn-helix domain-containing protein [Streptomyces sp. NPDC056121]